MTLSNVGTSVCLVGGPFTFAPSSDSRFSLVNAPAAAQLLGFPGEASNPSNPPESLAIVVRFTADPKTASAATGRVDFTVQQSATPQQSVPLTEGPLE